MCVVAYRMTSTGASGLFGRVGEFIAERETFCSYVERMEMFFTANNIVETTGEGSTQVNRVVAERKRAIFLTEVGAEVYSTVSNLLAPVKPKDTPFTEIVSALEKHYNPKPLEIAQSFHFGTRSQKLGESIGDYVLALKKLAIHCNYGEFLDRALRDRLVCGLSNPKIQNKLLKTEDLTFEKVCRIAKAMEMAERNTQEFRIHPTTSEGSQVNQLTTKDIKNNEQCFRCGGKHSGQSCKFKSAKCYRCSKISHLASVCRNKNETKKGAVHNLHRSQTGSEDELGVYSLYSLDTNSPNSQGYSVDMVINGKSCKMVVDTAADYSIMPHSLYQEKFEDIPLTASKVVLWTYTGERLDVSGEMQCDVVYKNKHYSLPVVVVNYSGKPTLLGTNWLSQIKLAWGEIFSVVSENKASSESQLRALLSKNNDLFSDSYAGMTGLEAHITMKGDVKPIFVKARRVPYALKELVEKELDKLEKHGVIKKTDKSSWASPIVVVPKSDNTVRICGDYKATINQAVEDDCHMFYPPLRICMLPLLVQRYLANLTYPTHTDS